ncbi:hypothetical protein HK100_004931 [Physocladia obscura]|uniref:Ribosomal protein L2 n=1 Tax=Physocladia obscura TaxID=109957 RepID=A0AAD5SUI4_9FUNG|nr:hypothetical protein HK100_004931 [Physocladia obscura]
MFATVRGFATTLATARRPLFDAGKSLRFGQQNVVLGQTPYSPLPLALLASQTRTKTYRKGITKPMRRYLKHTEELKRRGLPVPKTEVNVLENKFWKVSGGMKVYKPTSPGSRNRRHPTRFHLHKGSCIKRLSYGKKSTGGRNEFGRVTVRHRGSGHKRRVRVIDFQRNIPGPHQIVRLEYDPNRSADLALLRNLSTNEFSYIIHVAGTEPGTIVHSYRQGIPSTRKGEDPIPKNQLVQPGNCLRLRDIPVGTLVNNISLQPDGPAQICRSAGVSAQLIATDVKTGYAQIKLTSKEVRLLSIDCIATIGVVGNKDHHHTNLGKAGSKRHKGIRPTVRGIHQNPCDHPHGGGSNSKGNKHPRTPWGWLTKGWKTKLDLVITADLENITDLRPSATDYEWTFKVKCTNCQEEHPSWISFNAVTEEEIPNSRGVANFNMKCKSCKTHTNATIVKDSLKPYVSTSQSPQKILTIETRGLDFTAWKPTHGETWIAVGVDSGTVFDDIEFEEGERDWAGYDEKAACPVGVTGIEGSFLKSK